MANNSASDIRSALNTQLSAVSEIKSVKSGKTQTFAGFPACRYYLSGLGSEQEDTNNNYRTYKYTIDLICPVVIQDKDGNVTTSVSTLEAEFQDAVDALADKLEEKWTLSGNVDNLEIESSPVRVEEFGFGPANVLTLKVNARTLIALP